MKSENLVVRLHGEVVGILEPFKNGARFRFAESLSSAHPDSPLLSTALPVSSNPFPSDVTRNWFAGLLPEDARAEELLVSLVATGRLPGDIASEEDFLDPQLRELFLAMVQGRSPASLVEEQQDVNDRARVSRLLLSPPSESTDQLIRMAQDCLSSIRRRRLEEKIQSIMRSVNTLSGDEKKSAMTEVQALSAKLNRLKSAR